MSPRFTQLKRRIRREPFATDALDRAVRASFHEQDINLDEYGELMEALRAKRQQERPKFHVVKGGLGGLDLGRDTLIIGGSIVAAGALTVLLAKRAWPVSTAWPGWVAPLRGTVTSGWGDDRSYRNGIHEGIDIVASIGTPVVAVASGFVEGAFTGDQYAGNYLVVNHEDGFRSRYLHLQTITKSRGARVSRGEMIALSGASGIANSAAHLHFDVRAEGAALDAYIDRYGHPSPDFPARTGGYAVPAEALTPMTYSAAVLARVGARGVTFRCWSCPAMPVTWSGARV